jgi:serine/threonine-protein kinase
MYQRAEAAAAEALRLGPDLSDAQATAAYLRMVYRYDWAGAEQGLRRALELSPSSGYVLDLMARLCWATARYEEALPIARRAQTLDPAANRIDLTTMLLRAGRYEQALTHALDAVQVEPAAGRARATLGWAYFLNGRRDEGVAELERAVECSGRNPQWVAQLGEAYGMVGETAKARAILQELEERSRHTYVSPYHFAYVYTGLGESDRAMDLLERAVADRTGGAYSLKGSFLFAPLRGHPRFQALMRTMRLD